MVLTATLTSGTAECKAAVVKTRLQPSCCKLNASCRAGTKTPMYKTQQKIEPTVMQMLSRDLVLEMCLR